MMRVTGIFVAASVAGQLVFGMLIAALVCEGERRRLPGGAVVRAIVLVGWVLPGVVIGIIWKLLLDESGAGIMAYAASLLGARNPTFLSAPLPALVWVTVANIWRGTAFSMIMQYAGMKTVPPELYEAATVDGAGALQKFRYITLPSLARHPADQSGADHHRHAEHIRHGAAAHRWWPGRATEVIALYIYHLVFSEFQFGRGAAVAVVLMAIGSAAVRLLRAHAAKGACSVTDQEQKDQSRTRTPPPLAGGGRGEGGASRPRPSAEGAQSQSIAGYIVVSP